jgi:hypothetical protein
MTEILTLVLVFVVIAIVSGAVSEYDRLPPR